MIQLCLMSTVHMELLIFSAAAVIRVLTEPLVLVLCWKWHHIPSPVGFTWWYWVPGALRACSFPRNERVSGLCSIGRLHVLTLGWRPLTREKLCSQKALRGGLEQIWFHPSVHLAHHRRCETRSKCKGQECVCWEFPAACLFQRCGQGLQRSWLQELQLSMHFCTEPTLLSL